MLFPVHPKTAWKKNEQTKLKSLNLLKESSLEGSEPLETVSKNIQPSYSAKSEGNITRVIETEK